MKKICFLRIRIKKIIEEEKEKEKESTPEKGKGEKDINQSSSGRENSDHTK